MKRRAAVQAIASPPLLCIGTLPLFGKVAGTTSAQTRRWARPADRGWPSREDWETLNRSVGGRLLEVHCPLQQCVRAPASADCDGGRFCPAAKSAPRGQRRRPQLSRHLRLAAGHASRWRPRGRLCGRAVRRGRAMAGLDAFEQGSRGRTTRGDRCRKRHRHEPRGSRRIRTRHLRCRRAAGVSGGRGP